MLSSIRSSQRLAVQCLMSYRVEKVSVWGLLPLALLIAGCAQWTISPCEGTPLLTPCVSSDDTPRCRDS